MSQKHSLNLKEIDLHIHTNFSDGKCGIEEIIEIAMKKGLKILAITDHYSEFQAHSKILNKRQFNGYLEAIREIPALKGVEAEILEDGTVSISKKTKDILDIVIGGLHFLDDRIFWHDSRYILNPKKFVEDMRVNYIKSIESRLIDVIAHVTWLPEAIRAESKKLITDDWIKSIVKAASDFDIAIELNGAWKVPEENFVTKCLHQGVKLSIGSDAHEALQVGEVSYAINMLNRLSVSKDNIFIPKNK